MLLAIALLFTPEVVGILAPGLVGDPERYDLAVALTRITFPYLALVSLETLFAGILNANNRFAAAASEPAAVTVSAPISEPMRAASSRSNADPWASVAEVQP